ncbi:MAG: glucose-6-phosphate isomerase [Puniceicoccales bacterium]|jgi:glucose-6-phosphate isomerase|nr:glucose-6-phosphate isomerase [Puniceicoccales bacterium]
MNTWKNFQKYCRPFDVDGRAFAIDLSRARFPRKFFGTPETKDLLTAAYAAMAKLENGEIANPAEKRRVGHYWLRDANLAPDAEIKNDISSVLASIETFAAKVLSGEIQGTDGAFENFLCIGIGGSALGPQFLAALAQPSKNKITPYFLDNTDPDGMDDVFARLEGRLGRTLVIITSKSGSTKETANGMIETAIRYEAAALKFGAHAVAITGADSRLDKFAQEQKFLARFPMWDWVGGRTSSLSAVGLLPAALLDIPLRELLAGAAAMDKLTRNFTDFADEAEGSFPANPAALLALSWHFLTKGKGERDMVILPYKDRLQLFSRYLQQLVMESLGKGTDLGGNPVAQGIAVYGTKGSTDQHAFVQQLRDGVPNFFVTFVEVLRDRDGASQTVEEGVTSGDYLHGFFLGTREALSEKDRPSITLTIGDVSPFSFGMLIALFERAVGFYASFVNINAYDQPGVEAGKKAANHVLGIQAKIVELLAAKPGKHFTAEKIARKINLEDDTELVFKVCEHLAANPDKRIAKQPTAVFFDSTFTFTKSKH